MDYSIRPYLHPGTQAISSMTRLARYAPLAGLHVLQSEVTR
jgi:hypothetical protein